MNARALYFTGPREVRVDPEPRPEPGPGEVVVEATHSAASPGTELLIYRDEAPDDLTADATIDALDGDLSYPLQYGYALVGEVTRLGADVDADWRGETVFAFHPHETHAVVEPSALVPVPADVSRERATLLPTAETATNLVMDGDPGIGERVAVFGAGPVGLFTTAVLSAFPLETLTVVEPRADRRAVAADLGADETVTPAAAPELGDRGDPAGVDLAFELSGQPEALDDAMAAVGYDGRIVVGSWYGRKRADVDLGGFFHRNRVELLSSQVSTIDPVHRGRWTHDRRLATAWEQLRDVDVDALVTHRLPFERAPEGYALLADEASAALQVLFTYE
jgi:2-desacetyl-2-hydroxyethyl bacteriochlorophyllide A dehydrogenase